MMIIKLKDSLLNYLCPKMHVCLCVRLGKTVRSCELTLTLATVSTGSTVKKWVVNILNSGAEQSNCLQPIYMRMILSVSSIGRSLLKLTERHLIRMGRCKTGCSISLIFWKFVVMGSTSMNGGRNSAFIRHQMRETNSSKTKTTAGTIEPLKITFPRLACTINYTVPLSCREHI